MAERILDDDYRSTEFAFGIANYRYQLKYDPESGDYKVESTGLIPGTSVLAIKLYENGSWLLDALQNPNLFENGEKTALAIQVEEDIKRKVNAAYITIGGNAGGHKIHPSATPENIEEPSPVSQNQEPAVTTGSQQPQQPTDPLNVLQSLPGSITDAIKGFVELAKLDPNEIEKYLKFGEVDQNTIKGTKEIYPIDALYGRNQQDHIEISQYKYQPPRKNLLFGSNANDILTKGAQRGADFKKEDYIGFVKLPMPNDISDSNNVNWGEDAMNNLSAAITSTVLQNPLGTAVPGLIGGAAGGLLGVPGLGQAGVLLALLKNSGINLNDLKTSGTGGALVGSTVASRILSMAQLNVSAESILARGFGIAPNSNLELLFQSPSLREFQFNWKLSPRSYDEAQAIRKIIRFFKQGMAAKKLDGAAGGASFFLGTPNIFRLQYKTGNSQIRGLNRIKTCALTGTSVNYTPDGEWASYDGGQPVSSVISLRFQELEPIYDTDYQDKVIDGRYDLYEVQKDEVGY